MNLQLAVTDSEALEDILIDIYYEPPEPAELKHIGKSLGYPGSPEVIEVEKVSFPKDFDLITLEKELRQCKEERGYRSLSMNEFVHIKYLSEINEALQRAKP